MKPKPLESWETVYVTLLSGSVAEEKEQRRRPDTDDPRACVLTGDELLELFERKAQEALDRASSAYRALQVSKRDAAHIGQGPAPPNA